MSTELCSSFVDLLPSRRIRGREHINNHKTVAATSCYTTSHQNSTKDQEKNIPSAPVTPTSSARVWAFRVFRALPHPPLHLFSFIPARVLRWVEKSARTTGYHDCSYRWPMEDEYRLVFRAKNREKGTRKRLIRPTLAPLDSTSRYHFTSHEGLSSHIRLVVSPNISRWYEVEKC